MSKSPKSVDPVGQAAARLRAAIADEGVRVQEFKAAQEARHEARTERAEAENAFHAAVRKAHGLPTSDFPGA